MRYDLILSLIKEILAGYIIVENKEVKGQKKSGVIYIPMKYIGKRVVVIIQNENKETNT